MQVPQADGRVRPRNQNLAMVVGPNIMRQENESLVQSLDNSRVVGVVTDDFILLYQHIFEVWGCGAPTMMYAHWHAQRALTPRTRPAAVAGAGRGRTVVCTGGAGAICLHRAHDAGADLPR
jgi:hypothetical protein